MESPFNILIPWEELKEKLKEANTALLDSDLEYTPGKEEALLTRLATCMGRDKAHIKGWVQSVAFTEVKAS